MDALSRSQTVGAAPPPPGVVPNFANPESTGNSIIAAIIVCMILAFTSTALRFYARLGITRFVGLDDYLILCALVTALGLNVSSIVLVKFGLGTHMWDVPLSTFSPHFLKTQLAATMVYVPSIMFTKLSILVFYLRLTPEKTFRNLVYALMFIVAGYSIACDLGNLFTCTPMSKAWDVTIEDGWCLNRVAFYFANGAINVTTDLCMILLPIPLTSKLQMPLRQKIGLTLVFMTASFVCIMSIIRLESLKSFINGSDVTYITLSPDMWSAIETNVGIFCANLPSLRPLLMGRLRGSRRGPGSYGISTSSRHPRSHSYPLSSRDSQRLDEDSDLDSAKVRTYAQPAGAADSDSHWANTEMGIDDGPQPNGRIVKTSEIAVSYAHT